MRASFFEYQVAKTALFTARANLNVVSHNVANAGLPGYSRQTTLQKALPPLTFFDGRGMYGTGSDVYNIVQVRDTFIDRKYWSQRGVLGEYAAKQPQLSLMEAVFSDLSDSGVRTAFNDFFARLQELSRESHEPTFRTNVIMAGETLTRMVRNNAEALRKQQRDINVEVESVVKEINSLGAQITNLNHQIQKYEFDGSYANDLRDQRALLVDRLSEYVNVQVEEIDFSKDSGIQYDRRFMVSINGYDFVNHLSLQSFVCVPRNSPYTEPEANIPSRNEMDVDGLYDIRFANGQTFNIYDPNLQGTLKGLIDIRDGNNNNPTMLERDYNDPSNTDDPATWTKPSMTSVYKGIPFYMNKLNTLVRTFAKAINEGLDYENGKIPNSLGHVNGYDLDGNSGEQLFFTYESALIGGFVERGTGGVADLFTDAEGNDIEGDYDAMYKLINCLNFTINPQLLEDPRLLAAAPDPTQGESANEVVLGFINVNSYTSLFREGKLTDFIIGTADQLAIDLQQSKKFEKSYYEMTVATDNQRISVSGVDTNEEILNMVKYEQMYQAAAKLINTINNIYDTLIFRLGLGG